MMSLSALTARGVLLVALVTAGVASLPYAFAAASTPAHLVYTGLMFDVGDHAQYWAWVAASRDGLFISNTMTPEPNAPIFMLPMMWSLARVQAALALSFPWLFQVWRLAGTLLLMAALFQFVGTVLPDRSRARTALVFALAGSGFGWALVVWKYVAGIHDVPWPLDLYIVEPNTFFGLLAYPYLPLTQGLLLLAMTGVLRAHLETWWSSTLMAGASALLLALVHAYDLVTLYAVIVVSTFVMLVRHRRVPWRLVATGAFVAAASGPVALYYRHLTASDPLWRSVLAQYANVGVWTPPHVHILVLMGLPLALAAVGLSARAPVDGRRVFVAAWAATSAGLIYLPIVFQVKLLNGWQYPLAVLAAHAWHERVAPAIERTAAAWPSGRQAIARDWVARGLLIILLLPTNLYLFAWRFIELGRHAPPYYLHQDEVAALGWLSSHASNRDVVLSELAFGQWIPSHSRARPYLAHPAMTNRFLERRENVETFFGADTSEEWRRQLLVREQVSLVVRTDWSGSQPRPYDLRQSPLFEAVFRSPHTQIFRVRHAAVDRE